MLFSRNLVLINYNLKRALRSGTIDLKSNIKKKKNGAVSNNIHLGLTYPHTEFKKSISI